MGVIKNIWKSTYKGKILIVPVRFSDGAKGYYGRLFRGAPLSRSSMDGGRAWSAVPVAGTPASNKHAAVVVRLHRRTRAPADTTVEGVRYAACAPRTMST